MEPVLSNILGFIVNTAYAQAQVYLGPTIQAVTEQSKPGEIIVNIYNFALMLGGILAFGMIVYGAVRYTMSGGNPSGQSDARDAITQALLGLLLLMGAFVVLNLVNPELTGLGLPKLGKIKPISEGQAGPLAVSESAARAQLQSAGVVIATNTVANLRQETINETIRLKRACGCEVVVTSATGGQHEVGTYSHAGGYKIDLRSRDPNTEQEVALTKYIESSPDFDKIGPRSDDGAIQYRLKGTPATQEIIYAKEDDHWDVVVRPRDVELR